MDALESLKKFVFFGGKSNIDSIFFKMNYRVAFVVLLASSMLVTARQFCNSPIACTHNTKIQNRLVENFCWIQATFSVANSTTKTPYYGIAKSTPNSEKLYHSYYQWVGIMFFFQAILFYAPHYFWKICENGRTEEMVKDIRGFCFGDTVTKKITDVAQYFATMQHKHSCFPFLTYLFCELLNLINIIFQIWVLNKVFHTHYINFGYQMYDFLSGKVTFNPLDKLFPYLAKCTFHDFGSSGDIQKHDFLCVLSVNVINGKIFVMLWFFFWIVFFVNVVGTCAIYLYFLFVTRSKFLLNTVMFFKGRNRTYRQTVVPLMISLSYSDLFFLYLMSINLNTENYLNLIDEIKIHLRSVKPDTHHNNNHRHHKIEIGHHHYPHLNHPCDTFHLGSIDKY